VSVHKDLNSPQGRKERKAIQLIFQQVPARTPRLCSQNDLYGWLLYRDSGWRV